MHASRAGIGPARRRQPSQWSSACCLAAGSASNVAEVVRATSLGLVTIAYFILTGLVLVLSRHHVKRAFRWMRT
jgi:hypothetical protein